MPDLKSRMLATKENSSAVLKMRLILLKSKTSKKIFVFEGVDDKTVYSRWIKMACASLVHESFVCGGKRKLISLRNVVKEDRNNLAVGVYFCLDRDFDDAGVSGELSTYITGSYSFENYLVSDDILYEILRDDFHCHEEPELMKNIVDIFSNRRKEFYQIIDEVNFQIYFGVKNCLARENKLPDRIGKIVNVTLESVERNYEDINEIISFADSGDINEGLRDEFNKLNPDLDYRGKYNFLFFKRIIELLYDDIKSDKTKYFTGVLKDGWKPKLNLDIDNIAARSSPPECFKVFVENIKSNFGYESDERFKISNLSPALEAH